VPFVPRGDGDDVGRWVQAEGGVHHPVVVLALLPRPRILSIPCVIVTCDEDDEGDEEDDGDECVQGRMRVSS
jgi:hypothetical protein